MVNCNSRYLDTHSMVVRLDPIAGIDRWIVESPHHSHSHSYWQRVAAADTAVEMCQEPVASERQFENSSESRSVWEV